MMREFELTIRNKSAILGVFFFTHFFFVPEHLTFCALRKSFKKKVSLFFFQNSFHNLSPFFVLPTLKKVYRSEKKSFFFFHQIDFLKKDLT